MRTKDFLTSLHSHMNTQIGGHTYKYTVKIHARLIAIISMYSRLNVFLSIV